MKDLNRIKDYLICPFCKEQNSLVFYSDKIICKTCRNQYEIKKGIPIFLTNESENLLSSSSISSKKIGKFKQWLSKILKKLYLPRSYSPNKFYHRINNFLNFFKSNAIICNLGSGDINFGDNVINLDLFLSDNVDILVDIHNIPFAKESLDGIICIAVLEHVWNPFKVVEEIKRTLKKGGGIYIEIPFLQPYHPGTGTNMDYQRFTEQGFLKLFSEFKVIDFGVSGGPGVALSHFLPHYLSELLNFWHGHEAPREIIYIITGWILLPLKYLDPILEKRKSIASAFYFIGEKL